MHMLIFGCMESEAENPIDKLAVEEYGNNIPFAPDLNIVVPVRPCDEPVPIADQDQQSTPSSKASSTSSFRACIPHEFRWIEMKAGAWTVLKAMNVFKQCKTK